MWSIKDEICTIKDGLKDVNRINKRRDHGQFGDPFAVTLR